MTTATKQRSSPNRHIRRNEIERNVRRRSKPSIAILALLTSFVGGGRCVGGLLRGIIGPSRPGFREAWSSRGAAYGSFVSAVPLAPAAARSPSSHDAALESSSISTAADNNDEMASESCNADDGVFKVDHPDDPSLWLYHVEETTSVMDVAKSMVENNFQGVDTDDGARPATFMVSATSQSKGRGTTQRNWDSSGRGNALFAVGIPQSSWTKDLTAHNDGRRVPLTLLPLKVGSVVALHIQRALEDCTALEGATQPLPRVTVKWPNDVLLRTTPTGAASSPARESHEKIAGILIESAQDWFIVGIGVNVGYAPRIPREGADYGRGATCLSRHCAAPAGGGDAAAEDHWSAVSRALARDVARDLHAWLHPPPAAAPSPAPSGDAILGQWKAYLDWDMELVLRDTPGRERVTLAGVLEDGRAVVREAATGRTRTLVADYFV